jgi:hypothetical protein
MFWGPSHSSISIPPFTEEMLEKQKGDIGCYLIYTGNDANIKRHTLKLKKNIPVMYF